MLFINRPEIKIEVKKLLRKHKGKYRYSGEAKALVHNSTKTSSRGYDHTITSGVVYSRTRKGAEVTSLTKLLHQCRPPLTKAQKFENIAKKNEDGFIEHTRKVYIEVRVSNAFDFIMNSDRGNSTWKKIKR